MTTLITAAKETIAGAACDQITLRVANNWIDLWQNDGKTWDCCFFS